MNIKISTNYDIIPLNSEISRVRPSTGIGLSYMLAYAYSLTPINRKSLVFKFDNKDHPNVLFNADSNHSFYRNKLLIKPNSISTAPHHGSHNNERVYNKISDGRKSSSIIYVRSDKPNLPYRPCEKYTQLKTKYCTACNNSYDSGNVVLTFDSKIGNFTLNKD